MLVQLVSYVPPSKLMYRDVPIEMHIFAKFQVDRPVPAFSTRQKCWYNAGTYVPFSKRMLRDVLIELQVPAKFQIGTPVPAFERVENAGTYVLVPSTKRMLCDVFIELLVNW